MKCRLYSMLALAIPCAASAHLVPADVGNPELGYLRAEKRDDLAVGMAQYCAGMSLPIDVCIAQLGKDLLTAEAATECVQEVGWAPNFDATTANMIPIGTTPEGTKLMIFHNYYVNDKEFGTHRHDWTAGARDKAGTEYALWKVEQVKQAWSGTSATTSMGADLQGKYNGGAEVKLPGAQADTTLEVKGSGEVKKTEESKGPPPEKIQEAWDEGYAVGKESPWNTKVTPDILCTKDKTSASCNGGPDPTLQPAAAPEPTKTEPVKTTSTWPEGYPMSKESTKGISIDSGSSPLEECLQQRIQQKKEKEFSLNFAEPTENKKSLQERAEEALNEGVCLTEWYGVAFCDSFYMQQDMVIQPDITAPLIPELSKEEEESLVIDPSEEWDCNVTEKNCNP